MTHPTSLFGVDANRYLAMIDGLRLGEVKARYTFTASDEFERLVRKDPRKAMQVYWGEILVRAHWTAITAIFRNRRWISAIYSAVNDKNTLAFAASLRGLIESAADTHTALHSIPATLARDCAMIKDAILGKNDRTVFIVDQIENDLIHFAYARKLKKGEAAPANHRARTIQDYIDILERGKVQKIAECYSKLCDFTHPGASSVWLWVRPLGELELELAPDQEAETISWFLSEYSPTFLELLMFGFNGPVMTLAVLNYFPMQSHHTPALANWDLSGIPLWRKAQRNLAGLQVVSKTPTASET